MASKMTPLLPIFIGILRMLRRILDIFLHFMFSVMNFGKKEELPPITNLVLLESATSLAAKIRKKQLRSIDLVQAFISRIKDVQPYINAVVEQRIQLALKEAKEADKLIMSGEKSEEEIAKDTPFLGVPFTNKEAISVKGLLFTTGLVSRKSVRADIDANVIQLMKYAGGIPLAVTNVSELCMWWESYNNLHGRTNNPYDTNRTSGGSSGGEAALIAAAGSVIGIGSDIGGSIRIPACFNGIFGHKPTTGVVSNDGEFPIAEGDLDSFLSTGPLCRYATDLLPMMKILVGNNSFKLRLDLPVKMNTLKIYYMEDDGGNPLLSQVHPDMRKAMQKVLNHFEDAYKIKPQKLKLKSLRYAYQIWFTRMANSGAPTFSEEMAERKGGINCPVELLEWILGRSKFTLPAILLGITETFVSPTDSEENRKYCSMCTDLCQELQDILGDNGIFLYPPHPEPAPHHNEPVLKAFNFVYTAIFNVLGLPVTQCPLGLGSEGLPIGIQVAANFNNDHLTMAVAVELEKAFGGWVCPCPIAI